jgi:tetrahydromethanopterin S-methyltransferase subunit G
VEMDTLETINERLETINERLETINERVDTRQREDISTNNA